MKRIKIVCVGGVVVVGLMVSLWVQRRTQVKLREGDPQLQQQDHQVAEWKAANQRLSNLTAQVEQRARNRTDGALTNDKMAEIAQLRGKIEALRKQSNQLAQQMEANRRLVGTRSVTLGESNLLELNREVAATLPGGPRAEGKLNDARGLTAALRKYADEHQGEFPGNLDALAPYLPRPLEPNSPPWEDAPLTGTNDFEIVYQGSRNDLSNIPPKRVALVRERQPWLTPDGKWARTYGYADGSATIVESEDNFQSWDAQHIIPPSKADQ